MRGRPITGDEFDRMVAACDKARTADAPLWNAYLQGLWLSGLSLSESLVLSWNLDAGIAVNFNGKYSAMRIAADSEKGFRDRLFSLTSDFASFLGWTPVPDRVGKVFGIAELGLRLDTVSRIVSEIRRIAGALVNREQNKFASAHDLRRAFGNRWSSRVTRCVTATYAA